MIMFGPYKLKLDSYVANGTPAILMYDDLDTPCGVLTVNLDSPGAVVMNGESDGEWVYQYVDVNNHQGIEELLADEDWCEPTGLEARSGYVNYPLYKFKKEAFNGQD